MWLPKHDLHIGVAGIEFTVDFRAANKADDSTDDIAKFGGRAEIGTNYIDHLHNTANTVCLGLKCPNSRAAVML